MQASLKSPIPSVQDKEGSSVQQKKVYTIPQRHNSKLSRPKPMRLSISPTQQGFEKTTVYRTGLPTPGSFPTLESNLEEEPKNSDDIPDHPNLLQITKTEKPVQKRKKLAKSKGLRNKQWGFKRPNHGQVTRQSQTNGVKDFNTNNHYEHPYRFEPVMYSSSPQVTNYHYYNSNGPSITGSAAAYTPYQSEGASYPIQTSESAKNTKVVISSTTTTTPSPSSTQSPPPRHKKQKATKSKGASSTRTPQKTLQRTTEKSDAVTTTVTSRKDLQTASEERIVIRLPDNPPNGQNQNSNNFFSILPIPFSNLFSTSIQSQNHLSNHPYHSSSAMQQAIFAPTQSQPQQHPSYQYHQSIPAYYPRYPQYYPSPPPSPSTMYPSMLSYVFGRKKK
jgi:hypothetical protein